MNFSTPVDNFVPAQAGYVDKEGQMPAHVDNPVNYALQQ
ncbi:hypothetical protein J3D46_000907 [Paenarthrobacter sp. A20]|nr:hypothetical protein [Paenarthrobacter sp. A20]